MSQFYATPSAAAILLYGGMIITWAIVRPQWPSRLAGPAFWVLTAAALLFVRRHVLEIADQLNPDEALMAANAMRARFGWLDWNIVDPLTSGPLNSSVLVWPRLLGGDITLFSGRLTGAALCAGMLAFLYAAIRTLWNGRIALLAVLPAAIFLLATNEADFLHYSSEQLPIFLLAAAAYLLASGHRQRAMPPLLVAAIVLGAVPFAKLQAMPIAALIGAFVLAAAVFAAPRGRRLPAAMAVMLAALLPTAVFLAPLAVAGGVDDFIKSYLLEQQQRITGWQNPLPALLAGSGTLAVMFGAYLAVAVVGPVAFLVWRRPDGRLAARQLASLYLAIPLLAATIFAVVASGRPFPHYLLLALPAAIVAGGTLIGVTSAFGRRILTANGVAAALGALAVFLAAGPEHLGGVQASAAALQGRPITSPHAFTWLGARPSDAMVCWGWASQCYLDATVPPATREATNENQTYGTALKGYFRDRFLRDFDAAAPDFVMDAVFPMAFGFTDPQKQGVAAFPGFEERLDKDFVLASKPATPAACPRLYIRATRLAEIEEAIIAVAAVAGTPGQAGRPATALDDWSTNDICGDYWAPPPGEAGSARLTFRAIAPVRRIMLLSARGTANELTAATVGITLLDRGWPVFEKAVTLLPFPWWTTITLDLPASADALELSIPAVAGQASGINEVKAYRQ